MSDTRNPVAVDLALGAVKRFGSINGAALVCSEAGFRVSRPNLSRYLNNDLDSVGNIEMAIFACFDRHDCPYLGMAVDAKYCHDLNSGPVPTWDPAALDQRRCCQTCPNKPTVSGDKK